MSEGSKIIEIYKEIIALLHRVDEKYNSTKDEIHALHLRVVRLETGGSSHKEEIEEIKASLIQDFKEIDDNFERWDRTWAQNKKYVYFAISLGMVGASATMGFEFVVKFIKYFIGLK